MPSPARLLIVDDDESNRDLFGRRLMRLGYQVDQAADGYQALAMLERGNYDMVLLDQMMPGLDGLDVLRQVRQTRSAWLLPVIMVTAVDEHDILVSALKEGANDYITKPIEFSLALARIETQLNLAFATREMRRSHDLYHLAMSASEEGLWDWDLAKRTIYYSDRWKEMLGCQPGEVSDCPEEWFTRIHADHREAVRAAVQAMIDGRAPFLDAAYRIRHKDGSYRWFENRGAASLDAMGRTVRIAGCQSDITGRKTIDPLTSLPNRTWLDEELSELSTEGKSAALLLVELDRFHQFEEILSAGETDRFLSSFAARLRTLAESPGSAVRTVRSGSQQFAVLSRNTGGDDDVRQIAERLQAMLKQPLVVDGESYFASASLGIAHSTSSILCDRLFLRAGAALRHARDRGSPCEVYEPSIETSDVAEARLIIDLHGALSRAELVLYYQPKVDLATQGIVGFEALVRWDRPGHGLIAPDNFIPAAERSGLIVPIGLYVLDQACRDTVRLRSVASGMRVSVNVSGRQLAEPDLVDQVRHSLDRAALPPSSLQLEITETFLVEDPQKALNTLNQLREMGVGLKLDDFGSGYSSLDYLRRFPFDTLKVDRSFVSGLTSSHESAEIVRAIAGLAQSLHMELVAEGIETLDQFRWLRDIGCRYGQGYWFSPPVDFATAQELLKNAMVGTGKANP